MTTPTSLPTNIDTTYADSGTDPTVALHQQYHDTLHGAVNTLTAGAVQSQTNIIYASPSGSDSNSGLTPHLAKATISAALAALPSGYGTVMLAPHATFTITAGFSIDVCKQRLMGNKSVIDASALTSGAAITLTSSLTNMSGSYNNRNNSPILYGLEVKGSGRTNSVTGLSLSDSTDEIAHLKICDGVTVHDFGIGVSLGNNCHNIEFEMTIYNAGDCINDTAATSNAGERICFRGGAFFNSIRVAYLHNQYADYMFEGCSFDYCEKMLDVESCVVTLTAVHVEGNDANYTTNYPFIVGGTGSLIIVGGMITGTLTTIPAYFSLTSTTARVSLVHTKVSGTYPALWAGTGSFSNVNAQTIGDYGRVYSTTDRTATTGVVSTISLGTKAYDTTGNLFYSAANPNRITVPQAGFYTIQMKLQIAAAAGGTVRQVWAAMNGNDGLTRYCYKTYPVNTLIQDVLTETDYFATGTYFEIHTYHDATGSITFNAVNNGPFLSLTRVS